MSTKTCPSCGGTGKFRSVIRGPMDHAPCPDCHGRGRVHDWGAESTGSSYRDPYPPRGDSFESHAPTDEYWKRQHIFPTDPPSLSFKEKQWWAYARAHPEQQFNLARAYESGNDCEKDETKAAYWFLEAALNGDRPAMLGIATAYLGGAGVDRNFHAARYWYKQGTRPSSAVHASLVIPACKSGLATLLSKGLGGPRDPRRADELYIEAANDYVRDGRVDAARRILEEGAEQGHRLCRAKLESL